MERTEGMGRGARPSRQGGAQGLPAVKFVRSPILVTPVDCRTLWHSLREATTAGYGWVSETDGFQGRGLVAGDSVCRVGRMRRGGDDGLLEGRL
ncbi:protein of unknown function [Hyphomicrobium sp. MC1]|nr:protein of unknown function [Hyphomicrobium sp. MC1]